MISFDSVVFDFIKGKIELEKVILRLKELATIVRKKRLRSGMIPVEWQHIIVHHCGFTLRPLLSL